MIKIECAAPADRDAVFIGIYSSPWPYTPDATDEMSKLAEEFERPNTSFVMVTNFQLLSLIAGLGVESAYTDDDAVVELCKEYIRKWSVVLRGLE